MGLFYETEVEKAQREVKDAEEHAKQDMEKVAGANAFGEAKEAEIHAKKDMEIAAAAKVAEAKAKELEEAKKELERKKNGGFF